MQKRNQVKKGQALQNPRVRKPLIKYDIDALKEGIEKAKLNIAIFEEAINKEHKTIKEYRKMISVLEADLETCNNK